MALILSMLSTLSVPEILRKLLPFFFSDWTSKNSRLQWWLKASTSWILKCMPIRELTYLNAYVKRKIYSFHTFTFLANKSILEDRLFLPFLVHDNAVNISNSWTPKLCIHVLWFKNLCACIFKCMQLFFSFLALLFLFSSIYQTCVNHSSPSGN